MTLESPRLDDRTFKDIVEEALRRIPLYCPEWTDHNLSDPGITLIELFAWMTDIILYRLNRVPDRHYVKFLELLGIRLREPQPARVPVTFWLSAPQPNDITIPAGTEVATTRTETEPAITFTTDEDLVVRVPHLTAVLTSSVDGEGKRSYKPQNLKRLSVGFEGFPAFSEPPRPRDAIYFGFREDLSDHILGLEMDVEAAGGAGIDPANPPYVWEALTSLRPVTWTQIDIDEDTTGGLNVAGIIRLHLPRMVQGRVGDRPGYWVRCRLIEPGGEVRMYRVTPHIRKIEVASWGGTVMTTHATEVRNEWLGRSEGKPGQRFYLEHTPVLERREGETLLVRTEDGREEIWEEVRDFADSGPDDRHFTLDGVTGEIRLGPALPTRDGTIRFYGAIPPRGASLIFLRYRYGGGTIGNVLAGSIGVLKSGLPYIDRVSNRENATGGLDAESLEEAKLRAPARLRSLERAVTGADYEYLAMQAAPGKVRRVYCLQPPMTGSGEIKVLVIPRVARPDGYIEPDELELSDELRDRITAYLDERRLLTVRLDVMSPAYQWVSVRVRLHASSDADGEDVRRAAEARLYEFLNPIVGGPDGEGWPFGRDLHASDVMACLLGVPGVDFVRSVELYPIVWDKRGSAKRGDAAQEIPVVSHGVVASYRHDVRVD